jgi:hypothetical protein
VFQLPTFETDDGSNDVMHPFQSEMYTRLHPNRTYELFHVTWNKDIAVYINRSPLQKHVIQSNRAPNGMQCLYAILLISSCFAYETTGDSGDTLAPLNPAHPGANSCLHPGVEVIPMQINTHAVSLGRNIFQGTDVHFLTAMRSIMQQGSSVNTLGFEVGTNACRMRPIQVQPEYRTLDVIHVTLRGLVRPHTGGPNELTPQNVIRTYQNILQKCKTLIIDVQVINHQFMKTSNAIHLMTHLLQLDGPSKVCMVVPVDHHVRRATDKITMDGTVIWKQNKSAGIINVVWLSDLITNDIMRWIERNHQHPHLINNLPRVHMMWDAGFRAWGDYWLFHVAPSLETSTFETVKSLVQANIQKLMAASVYDEWIQPDPSFCAITKKQGFVFELR